MRNVEKWLLFPRSPRKEKQREQYNGMGGVKDGEIDGEGRGLRSSCACKQNHPCLDFGGTLANK